MILIYFIIKEKTLSKEEAIRKEKELIQLYSPKYNKSNHPEYKYPSKFTQEIKNSVLNLRQLGYSIGQISYLLGGDSLVSKENTKQMFVWRILNAIR